MGGYSRNLQYVEGTGRIVILRDQGISTIAHAEVDRGYSAGAHYQLVNRETGQVIGTGGKTNEGFYKFQAIKNTNVYLTGASRRAALTLQNMVEDGSQEWRLVRRTPYRPGPDDTGQATER